MSVSLFTRVNRQLASVGNALQAPFLLLVRLFWGWGFVQTGWGKLMHLDRTTGFFEQLGIPLPGVNAVAAGSIELIGGALLMIGLATRLASLPLIATMVVAFATAERAALTGIFRDPDTFTSAAPFLFLFASLLLLAFGAGRWSIDGMIATRATRSDP